VSNCSAERSNALLAPSRLPDGHAATTPASADLRIVPRRATRRAGRHEAMIIESRFNGPPQSGNGGYSAGLFASMLAEAGPAEVTLRRPPPLDVPLRVTGTNPVGVYDPDGELVAQVASTDAFQEIVPGVSEAEAEQASRTYPGFADHPFPTCYVCGPERPDGLRIFPGRLPDGRTAAPFVVPEDATTATTWAALDCPGGWSIIGPGRPYVLGRMAATVSELPAAGDGCVVVGAAVRTEGRKALVRSALYGPSGEPLAWARATWIAI